MAYQRKTDDELLDARYARREKAMDRYLTRLEKREAVAEQQVGTLCREGREVFYVYPVGGKYRESDSQQTLIDFLIRNHYA